MSRWAYVVTAVAGLAGAAGVIEAAAAAHRVSDPRLATSAHFLILNAAASIAINGFALELRARPLLVPCGGNHPVGRRAFVLRRSQLSGPRG